MAFYSVLGMDGFVLWLAGFFVKKKVGLIGAVPKRGDAGLIGLRERGRKGLKEH